VSFNVTGNDATRKGTYSFLLAFRTFSNYSTYPVPFPWHRRLVENCRFSL